MKFVLKVLALALLIIVSKLTKDQSVAMEKTSNATSLDLSKNTRQAVLLPGQRMMQAAEVKSEAVLHLD